MKTKFTIIKLVIASCTFATTAAFGQVLYQWTGAGDPTNIANANNWSPTGGPPSGATQDTGQWVGTPAGSINITYTAAGGLPGTGFGTSGVNWELTATQTGSVTWTSPSPSSANLAINNITLDSGSGPLILGDTTANILNLIGRPAGAVHAMINNSSSSATINQSVRWQAGGGNAYVLDFQGTGNWIINNNLRNDNGSGPTTIALEGPGNMTWASGNITHGNSPTGPIDINGGTMILKSSGLVPFEVPSTVPAGNNTIANNGTLLEFDAAAQSDTIARVISGTGALQVNNGTWTFSGQNTYSGNVALTGGELIAGTPENTGTSGPLGVGNTISFSGGTLGFNANNAFDYSPRFSTAAGQLYSFDTGGQSVTLATGLGGSGSTVTKVGPGTLTLSGTSAYSGTTTINAGELVFQGTKTGSGNISLADGAALGVTVSGTQVTPGTLAVGTASGATLEFFNVASTTTAPLAAGTLSSAGTVTVNINSGTFTVGQSYPLLTWTTGSAPTVALGSLNGFVGNLSFTGNTLLLNITATAFKWSGANNSTWDTTTLNNWIQNGASATYANNGTPAFFDDSATGPTSVTIAALVTPPNLTINNSTKTYSIASSSGNDIGGSGTLTKSGSGTATLSGGANSYTGVTTISGGTLSVSALANGGSASDIGAAANGAGNLVLNGGTLSYTGSAASIDRLFSLGTGGGTIDASGSGLLTLNNASAIAYVGSGARLLNLIGSNSGTLAASLADNGGATALTVNTTNKWVLTGNNTESGQTTINGGTLQIGAGGATGAIGTGDIDNESSLDFNVTGTLTVNGAISGAGAVTNDGSGTVILANNNSYSGDTIINAGTLQIGTGGAAGSLNNNGNITNNGTLVFNTTGNFNMNGFIAGTGSFTKQGTGLLKLLGTETYTGVTTIASGGVLQIFSGNQGVFGPGNIVVNGTLNFVRQDTGVAGVSGVISGTGTVTMDSNNDVPGDLTISNNCTYTGGTTIKGGAIILGDGLTSGFGSIVGNVSFAPPGAGAGVRSLTFNRPDNYTFAGNIGGNNSGSVIQQGLATVTLTGNNTYTNGTTVTTGTLQVGNGGTSGTIGTGAVTDNSVLVFDRSDNLTFGGAISGTGSLVQSGTGILTLTGTNTIAGATTVSNGTLVASSSGSDLDVMSGTSLAPGGLGTVGNLSVAGSLNMTSGTLLVTLNEASSPSNSTVTVAITTSITSSTLKLLNYGPSLNVGDTFTIFSGPVTGITTIVSPGYTFANNLATDGSVKVTAVAPPGTTLTSTVSGGNLNLTWPADLTGLNLQVQTNTLAVGLKNNWVTIPGTAAGNTYSAPLNRTTNTVVFYRLSPQ